MKKKEHIMLRIRNRYVKGICTSWWEPFTRWWADFSHCFLDYGFYGVIWKWRGSALCNGERPGRQKKKPVILLHFLHSGSTFSQTMYRCWKRAARHCRYISLALFSWHCSLRDSRLSRQWGMRNIRFSSLRYER